MSAKHTPGPWGVRDHWSDEGCFEVYPTHDGNRPPFGDWPEIVEVGATYEDEAEANARLIAAAPDMLAALLLATKAFDTISVSNGATRDAAAAARAAIAKATGGSDAG